MKYMLDAYNIIGQLDHIQLSDANKVNRFIDWLDRHRANRMMLYVVFDGQDPLVTFPRTQRRPSIVIIHTSGERSADDYIQDRINAMSDTSGWVVVSSDRAILDHAKKRRVKTMNATSFILMVLKNESSQDATKPEGRINQAHIDYWLNEFGGDV